MTNSSMYCVCINYKKISRLEIENNFLLIEKSVFWSEKFIFYDEKKIIFSLLTYEINLGINFILLQRIFIDRDFLIVSINLDLIAIFFSGFQVNNSEKSVICLYQSLNNNIN